MIERDAYGYSRCTSCKIASAAKHVRLNIAEMPLEVQLMIDHNGWLTVLRGLLDSHSINS